MKLKQVSMVVLITASAIAVCMNANAAPLDAYWQLNEVSTASPAVDSTGNLAAGTYGAGVDPTVAGPFAGFGTGANFSGAADSNIGVGGGTSLNFTNDFSTSAWVNFDNFAGKHSYLGNLGWALRNQGNGTGTPHITTFGVKDYFGNAGELSTGTWHHVVTVLDSNNDLTFYVDGAFAGTDAHNAPASGNSTSFAIGSRQPGNGFESMVGSADDIGVFSTSLTATEVAAIYNLAITSELEYDLGESNTLLEAFDNGASLVEIDGVFWSAATGLGGAEGAVVAQGDGTFAINLGNGNGFQSIAIPEPASIALWSLMGIAGIGYYMNRLRRRRD